MSLKNASGSQKRKARAAKQEEIRSSLGKCLKLDNFLQPQLSQFTLSSSPTSTAQSTHSSSQSEPKPMAQFTSSSPTSTAQSTHSSSEPMAQFTSSSPTSTAKCTSSYESMATDLPAAAHAQHYSHDPAEWEITENLRDYFVKNPPKQSVDDFSGSMRLYSQQKRYFSRELMFRKVANGERVQREWLVYSPSTGSIFCYVCRLFCDNNRELSGAGYNDWKNASIRLSEHEGSSDHRRAILALVQRSRMSSRIDSQLITLYEKERQYWRDVLKRIVAVIFFLSERGLAFRGQNETVGSATNGNYLGTLELLAQFDPFLKDHLIRFGNKGKGCTSYLSSTTCDEFIILMGGKLLHMIVNHISQAKYYSLSLDSTPDVSNSDQMTLIIRYVSPEDNSPVERFLKFIPITGHRSEYLATTVLTELDSIGIDIKNCRGQSYDNASNMAGQYSGVQMRIKEKNSLVEWVPCASHSLNLVGVCAADCCVETTSFFGIVQRLYTFLSASTKRWNRMKGNLKDGALVPKCLSETRWSARHEACKSLAMNYNEIRETLTQIFADNEEVPNIRHEAQVLSSKLDNLETAILTLLWKDIMEQFHKTNTSLQTAGIPLHSVVKMYNSLVKYVEGARTKFDEYEQNAKHLARNDYYRRDFKRNICCKRNVDDSSSPAVVFSPREEFKISTYLVVVDKLLVALNRRKEAYEIVHDKYDFLTQLTKIDDVTVRHKARHLIACFPSDLEADSQEEFVQMKHFAESLFMSPPSALQLLQSIKANRVESTFANVAIALRLYLCLLCTNCEGERSFSLMARVKNFLRSTMCQERLNSLAILSIESELARSMSYDDVIDNFAELKSRQRTL